MYYTRTLEKSLKRLVKQYAVLTITGPRQSGKTTLCKKVFPQYDYISLENIEVRRRVNSDPISFFENYKKGVIIDEIQRVPDLLSYIQTEVDESKKPGLFILTGSAQFEMMNVISQSLAGRTAIVKLLPFSLAEAYPGHKIPSKEKLMYKGFYPRLFDEKLHPSEATSFYISTYLERDVRNLINVKDLSQFTAFLKLCASYSGQLTNFSEFGNAVGIKHATASSWLSVLETSYLVFKLRPHHANFKKRLVKASKLYLLDTAIMSFLLEIEDPVQIDNHPLKGALFESFVTGEILKQRFNQLKSPNLFFWRDNNGNEIDLILDFGTNVLPIEIKYGKTVNEDFFKNLKYYQKLNSACKKTCLIYGGNTSYQENDCYIISYKDLDKLSGMDHNLKLKL